MAWPDAKARIKTILAGVSGVKRVYDNPPAGIEDRPCFVIYPPALEVQRLSGGWREKVYTVRMRLLLTDEDIATATALIETYRELMIDAFDAHLRLFGDAGLIEGPRVDEARSFPYGGDQYTGMDCFLTVRMDDEVTYGV